MKSMDPISLVAIGIKLIKVDSHCELFEDRGDIYTSQCNSLINDGPSK